MFCSTLESEREAAKPESSSCTPERTLVFPTWCLFRPSTSQDPLWVSQRWKPENLKKFLCPSHRVSTVLCKWGLFEPSEVLSLVHHTDDPSGETEAGPHPLGSIWKPEPLTWRYSVQSERSERFILFLNETEATEQRKTASKLFIGYCCSVMDLGARGLWAGILCFQQPSF